jgi:hypothetical protein
MTIISIIISEAAMPSECREFLQLEFTKCRFVPQVLDFIPNGNAGILIAFLLASKYSPTG